MDQTIICELFGNCLQIASGLGTEDYVTDKIRAALPRLPALRIAEDGRLAEWRDDFEECVPQHCHLSHLYGLYPGRAIIRDMPDLIDVVRKSLEKRGESAAGWSLAWKINL